MDALISAGGIPKPEEPLYALTEGKPKALLKIAGKPIVQWVLDAVSAARNVDRIVVVGLEDSDGLTSPKPVSYLPNQGGLLENVFAGTRALLDLNPESKYVVSVSSDIPAIRPEMIDWIIDIAEQSEADIYYSVITRQAMEARFPKSNRSYMRLKDQELCGGDINVFRASLINRSQDLVQRILDSRKSPIKQAALIGFDSLLLLLLRQLTVEDAARRVSRRLNLTGQAVICPYPEVGMDVDKPFQYEILAEELQARASA